MTAGTLLEAPVGDTASTPARDRERFESFYAEHGPRLVGFVRLRCWLARLPRSRVDPEDVAQEVFTEAWAHWSTIEQPRAWVYTVARRRLRERAEQVAALVDEDPAELADRQVLDLEEIGALQDEPFQAMLRAEIYAALLQLPPQQRTATFLFHVADFPVAEIAERLGCSQSTVGVHVHRGIKAVRAQLAEQEPAEIDRSRWVKRVAAGAVAVLAVVMAWVAGASWISAPPSAPLPGPTPEPGSPWIPLGDSSGGGVSWILIALGVLLVGFGIVAIVMLLRRRGDDDDAED